MNTVYIPVINNPDFGEVALRTLFKAKMFGYTLPQWNQMLKVANPGKLLSQIKGEIKDYHTPKEHFWLPDDFQLKTAPPGTHQIDKQINQAMKTQYTGPPLNPEHTKENLTVDSSKYSPMDHPNHDAWFYNPETNHLYYMANGHHVNIFSQYGLGYHDQNGFAGDVKNGVIRDYDETGTINQVPRHILPEIGRQWKMHRGKDPSFEYDEPLENAPPPEVEEEPELQMIDWGVAAQPPEPQKMTFGDMPIGTIFKGHNGDTFEKTGIDSWNNKTIGLHGKSPVIQNAVDLFEIVKQGSIKEAKRLCPECEYSPLDKTGPVERECPNCGWTGTKDQTIKVDNDDTPAPAIDWSAMKPAPTKQVEHKQYEHQDSDQFERDSVDPVTGVTLHQIEGTGGGEYEGHDAWWKDDVTGDIYIAWNGRHSDLMEPMNWPGMMNGPGSGGDYRANLDRLTYHFGTPDEETTNQLKSILERHHNIDLSNTQMEYYASVKTANIFCPSCHSNKIMPINSFDDAGLDTDQENEYVLHDWASENDDQSYYCGDCNHNFIPEKDMYYMASWKDWLKNPGQAAEDWGYGVGMDLARRIRGDEKPSGEGYFCPICHNGPWDTEDLLMNHLFAVHNREARAMYPYGTMPTYHPTTDVKCPNCSGGNLEFADDGNVNGAFASRCIDCGYNWDDHKPSDWVVTGAEEEEPFQAYHVDYTLPSGQKVSDYSEYTQRGPDNRPDPDYPRGWCFGYLNNTLYIGDHHHALIIASLRSNEFHGDSIAFWKTPMIWGWCNNEEYPGRLSVFFASDDALQSSALMQPALHALEDWAGMPAKNTGGSPSSTVGNEPGKRSDRFYLKPIDWGKMSSLDIIPRDDSQFMSGYHIGDEITTTWGRAGKIVALMPPTKFLVQFDWGSLPVELGNIKGLTKNHPETYGTRPSPPRATFYQREDRQWSCTLDAPDHLHKAVGVGPTMPEARKIAMERWYKLYPDEADANVDMKIKSIDQDGKIEWEYSPYEAYKSDYGSTSYTQGYKPWVYKHQLGNEYHYDDNDPPTHTKWDNAWKWSFSPEGVLDLWPVWGGKPSHTDRTGYQGLKENAQGRVYETDVGYNVFVWKHRPSDSRISDEERFALQQRAKEAVLKYIMHYLPKGKVKFSSIGMVESVVKIIEEDVEFISKEALYPIVYEKDGIQYLHPDWVEANDHPDQFFAQNPQYKIFTPDVVKDIEQWHHTPTLPEISDVSSNPGSFNIDQWEIGQFMPWYDGIPDGAIAQSVNSGYIYKKTGPGTGIVLYTPPGKHKKQVGGTYDGLAPSGGLYILEPKKVDLESPLFEQNPEYPDLNYEKFPLEEPESEEGFEQTMPLFESGHLDVIDPLPGTDYNDNGDRPIFYDPHTETMYLASQSCHHYDLIEKFNSDPERYHYKTDWIAADIKKGHGGNPDWIRVHTPGMPPATMVDLIRKVVRENGLSSEIAIESPEHGWEKIKLSKIAATFTDLKALENDKRTLEWRFSYDGAHLTIWPIKKRWLGEPTHLDMTGLEGLQNASQGRLYFGVDGEVMAILWSELHPETPEVLNDWTEKNFGKPVDYIYYQTPPGVPRLDISLYQELPPDKEKGLKGYIAPADMPGQSAKKLFERKKKTLKTSPMYRMKQWMGIGDKTIRDQMMRQGSWEDPNYDLREAMKDDKSLQFRYSYDGETLHIWPYEGYKSNSHYDAFGSEGYKYHSQGRIYVTTDDKIHVLIWSELHPEVAWELNEWCRKNLGKDIDSFEYFNEPGVNRIDNPSEPSPRALQDQKRGEPIVPMDKYDRKWNYHQIWEDYDNYAARDKKDKADEAGYAYKDKKQDYVDPSWWEDEDDIVHNDDGSYWVLRSDGVRILRIPTGLPKQAADIVDGVIQSLHPNKYEGLTPDEIKAEEAKTQTPYYTKDDPKTYVSGDWEGLIDAETDPKSEEYRYSYDGNDLDVWPIYPRDDDTGQSHFDKYGIPGYQEHSQGRIYLTPQHKIYIMVWSELHGDAKPKIIAWCKQNLGTVPTHDAWLYMADPGTARLPKEDDDSGINYPEEYKGGWKPGQSSGQTELTHPDLQLPEGMTYEKDPDIFPPKWNEKFKTSMVKTGMDDYTAEFYDQYGRLPSAHQGDKWDPLQDKWVPGDDEFDEWINTDDPNMDKPWKVEPKKKYDVWDYYQPREDADHWRYSFNTDGDLQVWDVHQGQPDHTMMTGPTGKQVNTQGRVYPLNAEQTKFEVLTWPNRPREMQKGDAKSEFQQSGKDAVTNWLHEKFGNDIEIMYTNDPWENAEADYPGHMFYGKTAGKPTDSFGLGELTHKWSYDDGHLDMWPVDEKGDPSHKQRIGPQFVTCAQGRIYRDNKGHITNLTWLNRGTKIKQNTGIALVDKTLMKLFGKQSDDLVWGYEGDWDQATKVRGGDTNDPRKKAATEEETQENYSKAKNFGFNADDQYEMNLAWDPEAFDKYREEHTAGGQGLPREDFPHYRWSWDPKDASLSIWPVTGGYPDHYSMFGREGYDYAVQGRLYHHPSKNMWEVLIWPERPVKMKTGEEKDRLQLKAASAVQEWVKENLDPDVPTEVTKGYHYDMVHDYDSRDYPNPKFGEIPENADENFWNTREQYRRNQGHPLDYLLSQFSLGDKVQDIWDKQEYYVIDINPDYGEILGIPIGGNEDQAYYLNPEDLEKSVI